MKILSSNLISLSLLPMLFFCVGCNDSSQKEKMGSSNRPKEETSTLRFPNFRKKAEASVKTEKNEKESSQSAETREEESSNAPMTEEKGKNSSPGETKKGTFSSETSRKDSAPNGEQKSSGNAGGTQSGTDKAGTDDSNRRRTAPAGWISTNIENPPSLTNFEIWNNILIPLETLIVAKQVKFSPLGACHTSLTDLSEGTYKAIGRCTVTEKSGNQIAYEFECIALVNKYEAAILSVKFHSPR